MLALLQPIGVAECGAITNRLKAIYPRPGLDEQLLVMITLVR